MSNHDHLVQALRDIIGMCRTSDPVVAGIKRIAEDALPVLTGEAYTAEVNREMERIYAIPESETMIDPADTANACESGMTPTEFVEMLGRKFELTRKDEVGLKVEPKPKEDETAAARAFLEKFPGSIVNDGCLQDMACPKCGEREVLHITATSVFQVYDEGTDDHEDVEWDGDSHCCCRECGHEGKVKDFQIPFLDAEIEARTNAEKKGGETQ